jgi:hypothetical protein
VHRRGQPPRVDELTGSDEVVVELLHERAHRGDILPARRVIRLPPDRPVPHDPGS